MSTVYLSLLPLILPMTATISLSSKVISFCIRLPQNIQILTMYSLFTCFLLNTKQTSPIVSQKAIRRWANVGNGRKRHQWFANVGKPTNHLKWLVNDWPGNVVLST